MALKWQSVTSALPEEGAVVLALFAHVAQYVAVYEKGKWWASSGRCNSGTELKHVTHWAVIE